MFTYLLTYVNARYLFMSVSRLTKMQKEVVDFGCSFYFSYWLYNCTVMQTVTSGPQNYWSSDNDLILHYVLP